ncbi:nucleolar protein 4-like isoform X2 [Ruditapes philippinarum]|uniref:nucleolar protein 4-like isoform X2 n=1 Tax=Ruditapes philippinarum TaxID=129788 RepID=UPI00295AB04B|nr:nucleolar protein 4-like isoform X2 [Ruditapes philippinarum]
MLALDKHDQESQSGVTNGITDANKKQMFDTFQTWALKTYGDSGKTKTVTRKKYERIVRILTGDEEPSTENSKFRFWVKAKGFKLGPGTVKGRVQNVLYVPVKTTCEQSNVDHVKEYKRVAIVEEFFDIIYSVHVEMDGRGGKHAGQKRTYRAIAETYSFLPREAVTRFLMACADCQKRMHIGSDVSPKHNNNNNNIDKSLVPRMNNIAGQQPQFIDYSVPITQTYLNHMRNNGYLPSHDYMVDEESMSSINSEMSTETSSSPLREGTSPKPESKTDVTPVKENGTSSPVPKSVTPVPAGDDFFPLNMSNTPNSLSPVSRDESKGHPERKRKYSDDDSLETSSKASESGTLDDSIVKDDDDDNDDDDEDKVPPGSNIDPERLKSFNMFCRLFVDENLDRMVPISKQPKDKVQAILDACDRQFPEFHERARKRIRTYLKSCRRMRRSKENGWEPLRPTPPHLTSAAAESYLAQACENESINAKRMRMGLEPLPASAMPITHHPPAVVSTLSTPQKTNSAQPSPPPPSRSENKDSGKDQTRENSQSLLTSTAATLSHDRHTPVTVSTADFIRHPPPPTAFRPPPEFPPFFANGNGLFRPGFPGYQHPAHHHPPVLHSPIQATSLQNGPTDLSMKKSSSKNQLSSSEITTIKQLISGYRESAAFLYRSADELEQLLLQQN